MLPFDHLRSIISRTSALILLTQTLLTLSHAAFSQEQQSESEGVQLSRRAIAARVREISEANDLGRFKTVEEWNAQYPILQAQLLEMLGLSPMPQRTDLHAITTGVIEQDDLVVERIHFQSLPGLYMTGNLYRPKEVSKPLPTVLYVCGHGQVKEDGRSLGNKTYYQHHPIWFATHGYVCMAIDTIQLGEIEGMHHGLYSFNRWDWPSLGYTPAGVEAWNSMRAIDYLVSRPEVDPTRIGITGRSGGGAYSWYTAAIDSRISVAAPVAGITDMHDHVLRNCISGHCDCMYMVNRFGWDFQTLAAMVVPRSLLIVNTDEDPIFPLSGVERIQAQVKKLYRLNKAENLGIHWTTGGHDDTQELQLGTFVWFDRFLQGGRREIRDVADKRFKPAELRVFDQLPADERVTKVQDWFISPKTVEPPTTKENWQSLRASIVKEIADSARGRLPFQPPDEGPAASIRSSLFINIIEGDTKVTCFDIDVHPESKCRIYTVGALEYQSDEAMRIVIPGKITWAQIAGMIGSQEPTSYDIDRSKIFEACQIPFDANVRLAIVIPEATGPWHWDSRDKVGLHLRRSYLLAGWSIEGRQIAGVDAALKFLKNELHGTHMELRGDDETSLIALHAGLLNAEALDKVVFRGIPDSYRQGFNLIGILQRFDLPQTLAALADRVPVELNDSPALDSAFVNAIAKLQSWPAKQFVTSEKPTSE
jgi:dienelactone hydrolase